MPITPGGGRVARRAYTLRVVWRICLRGRGSRFFGGGVEEGVRGFGCGAAVLVGVQRGCPVACRMLGAAVAEAVAVDVPEIPGLARLDSAAAAGAGGAPGGHDGFKLFA